DQRLTARGIAAGCVGGERAGRFDAKARALTAARALASSLRATPPQLARTGLSINQDGVARSVSDLLRYPDIGFERLAQIWPVLHGIPAEIVEQLEIDARYAGSVERQEADIRDFRRDEALLIPEGLD